MLNKICHSNIVIIRKAIYTLTDIDFKKFAINFCECFFRFSTGISYFSAFLYEDFFISPLPVKNVSFFWHFSLLSVSLFTCYFIFGTNFCYLGCLSIQVISLPLLFFLMTSIIHGFRQYQPCLS